MTNQRHLTSSIRKSILAGATFALSLLILSQVAFAAVTQKTFTSADEAVQAFMAAIKSDNTQELLAILGPKGKDLVASGDAVADKEKRAKFVALYQERNSLVPKDGDMILQVGQNDFPFPIPLVKKGSGWYFDTAKGREEILNRRIGANELDTIKTMLAIVDAQREYIMKDRDHDGMRSYADRFASDPGTHNGLYWETKEGEQPSPLGDLIAKAQAQGYRKGENKGPIPYHGYIYRILTKQGSHAGGGALDYMVNGRLVGGFAVVAYPAAYGNSGVMTFIVNHDGVIYQKNLGRNTGKKAKEIKAYDPGPGWKKVDDGNVQKPAAAK
jgi:hypothetical protein